MKVFISNIGTEIGGIETSLINFLNYIVNKNLEIDLLLWKDKGPLFAQLPKDINIIPPVTPGRLKTIIREKKIKNRLFKLFWYIICKFLGYIGVTWKAFLRTKKQYDIAISYCQNGYSPYYTIDKVEASKKYLYYHHGSYDNQGRRKKRDLKYFLKYNGIIVPSISCADMLISEFKEIKDKIIVIPNIINIDEILKKAKEDIVFTSDNDDKFKIATVSRISYEKGIDISIDVAKKLMQKKIDFIWYFIGDGEYKDEILIKIKEYNLEKRCILLGSKDNPFPYEKKVDLIVQTSRVEAHPIAIIEALILGKPLIASEIPAIASILKKYKSGYLCKLSADSFANAIKSFYLGELNICLNKNIKYNINDDAKKEIDKLFEGVSQNRYG